MYRTIIFSSVTRPQLAEEMILLVCHALQLRKNILISGRNSKEVACARQIICYLLCRYTDVSFGKTGRAICRSRPAVHYNFNEALKHIKAEDPLFMQYWNSIIPLILQRCGEIYKDDNLKKHQHEALLKHPAMPV